MTHNSEATDSDPGYAGDVSPSEAWDLLDRESGATLIDVRTTAEWSYVGMPDIGALDKEVVKLGWKQFPAMSVNPHFVRELQTQGLEADQALLFLCRSGVRSKDAAIAMTRAGFRRCYNIAEGFEGDRNDAKHRGSVGGWKLRGLPWVQE